jgi:hypothetical protein
MSGHAQTTNGGVETATGARRSTPHRGIAAALLAWAAGAHGDGRTLANESPEDAARQLQHAVDAGLAPLLHHAARHGLEGIPADWHDVLKGAEMTARFTHAALRESASHVIDVCSEVGAPVTLLKGISISDQYYPAPHLRAMGDVDVLVPDRDFAQVESRLIALGYVPQPGFETGEGEPHGAPLFDPRRRVWVELHTALFHQDAPVNANALFRADNVARRSVASRFDGRSILRLCDELQLVYIASYWLRDLTRNRMHPALLIPLFDAIFLLRASGRTLDWDALIESLDNEIATASLYLLLVQLRKYGFDEGLAAVVPRLAARQRIVGDSELRILNFLLETFLVDGKKFMGSFGRRHPMIESVVMDTLLARGAFAGKVLSLPWNVFFPPRVPERYSVGYQTARIARLLKRSRPAMNG